MSYCNNDVGLVPNLAEGGTEDTNVATSQDLGSAHLRIGTNTGLVHMGADV